MSGGADPAKAWGAQVEAAAARLEKAIGDLELAIDARLERENAINEAEAEVQRMGADRARLADSLDKAEARSKRLEGANREVSRRLVNAMESIRAVLDKPANGAA
jgi:chromosome segregation ATPase